MRKLKLQVQTTIDGYIGGPNGEMDWVNMNWDEGVIGYVQQLTDSFDTIVMGRKLAEGFIPHWAGVAADDNSPEQAVGKLFSDAPKVVFSNTLKETDWENVTLATDVASTIKELKAQEGKDIIAYGGASFVSSLIKEGLVDEYHLFVNPTAIGTGLSIFNQLDAKQELKLVNAQAFDCGIVVMHYEPKS